MKKIKKLSVVIVALAICLLFTGTVWAQGTGANTFAPSLDSLSVELSGAAEEVTFTISASTAVTLYGVEGTVQVPSGWTILSITSDTLTGFAEESNVQDNVFVWYAPGETETTIVPVSNVTELLKVKVSIPANTTAGEYEVGLSSIEYVTDIDYANGTATVVDNRDSNGEFVPVVKTLTVTQKSATDDEVLYGDANGDGSIDARDLSLLQQYIAEWDVTLDEVTADVNGDSSIDARDLSLLQQYIAEWDVTLGPVA